MAVIDANAIIEGGEKLSQYADKFVSVPEVMEEVRDPVSRHRLAFTPFSVQTMEPTPESLNKGIILKLQLGSTVYFKFEFFRIKEQSC